MLLKNEYASPLTTDKNVLNENATKLIKDKLKAQIVFDK